MHLIIPKFSEESSAPPEDGPNVPETDFPIYLLVCEGDNPRRGPALEKVRAVFGRDPIVTEGVHKNAPDLHERTGLPAAAGTLPGQIACGAGHRAMLKAFLATEAEHALILEDDIHFYGGAADFAAAFAELRETRPGWEWVLFRQPFDWPEDAPVFDDGPPGVLVRRALRLPCCTVCYGVSRAGAEKLLAKSMPLPRGFDTCTSECGADNAYMGPVLATSDFSMGSIIVGG